jgi:ABC-type nitrate/sulfonate/bicarbonate transport system permease component
MTGQSPDEVRIVGRPDEHPSSWRRALASDWLKGLASPLLLLLIWEIAVRSGVLDSRFFPAPSSVLGELIELARSGELLTDLGWSAQRVAIGFFLGAIPGIVLGLALGLSPVLNAFLRPIIGAIYPVPKVALFPLVMMVFGLGETSKWAIVALAVFFQVFFSTLAGVVNIEPIYLDVAKSFGASRWQSYRSIALPAALPYVLTGCQLGLGMALIVVVVAEQFGTKTGLGFLIWRSWQVFEVRDMFVGLMMVALLGTFLQFLMNRLEHVLVRWKARAKPASFF